MGLGTSMYSGSRLISSNLSIKRSTKLLNSSTSALVSEYHSCACALAFECRAALTDTLNIDLSEVSWRDTRLAHARPGPAPETDDTYHLGLFLPIAENAIRIVHDTAHAPESFAEAGRRFMTAQRVLFLGFGFGAKNVERLGTHQIPAGVPVVCTTYGMTPAEVIDMVIPAFPHHTMSDLRHKDATDTRSICLFLREQIQLLR
jgi:hypothetical protein